MNVVDLLAPGGADVNAVDLFAPGGADVNAVDLFAPGGADVNAVDFVTMSQLCFSHQLPLEAQTPQLQIDFQSSSSTSGSFSALPSPTT